MALAVVSVQRTSTPTSTNTVSSGTQSHAAGNALVMLLQFQNNAAATVSTVSNTAGDTWTQIPANSPFNDNVSGGGTENFQAIYYVTQTLGNVSDNVTVLFSAASGYNTMSVYELSGHDTTAAFYVTSNKGSSATGPAIATGTLTLAANSIIIAILETDGGPTPTTGYTGLTRNDTGGFVWDMYKLTASSQTASATAAGAGKWGVLAAAFLEGSGGAAFIPPPPHIVNQAPNRAGTY